MESKPNSYSESLSVADEVEACARQMMSRDDLLTWRYDQKLNIVTLYIPADRDQTEYPESMFGVPTAIVSLPRPVAFASENSAEAPKSALLTHDEAVSIKNQFAEAIAVNYPNHYLGLGLAPTDNGFKIAIRVGSESAEEMRFAEFAAQLYIPGIAIDIEYTGPVVAADAGANQKTPEQTVAELIQDLDIAVQTDQISRGDFRALFAPAVNILSLDVDTAAGAMKTSRPTVERWVNGSAAPHRVGRQSVFNALHKIAANHLELNERLRTTVDQADND